MPDNSTASKKATTKSTRIFLKEQRGAKKKKKIALDSLVCQLLISFCVTSCARYTTVTPDRTETENNGLLDSNKKKKIIKYIKVRIFLQNQHVLKIQYVKTE